MTILAVCFAAPSMVLARPVGRAIAHHGPRTVAVVSCLGAAVTALGMAADLRSSIVLPLMALQGVARAGMISAGDIHPSALGWSPNRASAAQAYTAAVPVIVGPGLSALILSCGGPTAALTTVAVLYLIAAAVIALAAPGRRPTTQPRSTPPTGSEARRLIAGAAILWLPYGSLSVLEPLYVRDVLHDGTITYALLTVGYGLSALAVCLVISARPGMLARSATIAVATAAIGTGQMIYISTGHLTCAVIGDLLWGGSNAIYIAATRTRLLVVTVPGAAPGAIAAWRGAQSGGALLTTITAGVTTAALGLQPTLIIGGILACGTAIWLRR
jgi:hypothetical protein